MGLGPQTNIVDETGLQTNVVDRCTEMVLRLILLMRPSVIDAIWSSGWCSWQKCLQTNPVNVAWSLDQCRWWLSSAVCVFASLGRWMRRQTSVDGSLGSIWLTGVDWVIMRDNYVVSWPGTKISQMPLLFVNFKKYWNFLVNVAFVIFVNISCYAINDMKYAVKISYFFWKYKFKHWKIW